MTAGFLGTFHDASFLHCEPKLSLHNVCEKQVSGTLIIVSDGNEDRI